MRIILASLAALTLAACQTTTPDNAMPPPEPSVAFPHGEMTPLPPGMQIDGRLFLAAPPAPGSAADRADLAISLGPWTDERTVQAREDNQIDAFAAFDNVLGADFTAARFPATNTLLRRVTAAAGLASQPPKDYYQKDRPFVRFSDHPTCITPEAYLRTSGSYPSGHASIGFAWGLTLAAALPARSNALIERGIDFGQSRVVCGVHWQSDVDAGQLLGAAAFAQLQSDAAFQSELAAARAELAGAYPN
ncbi:MAG: phosphatase PAP2 family protein [Hyphomonadaceae bacterium]|nr:phosphatase PAP2 family protein [Hyphomonadaceae bacterium]